jgi:Domain of unknown function (DUF6378)
MSEKMNNEILAEADRIINGDRQVDYGTPEDCFGLIAGYWQRYLSNKISACEDDDSNFYIEGHDVAMMMVLLKVARTNGQKKTDNYVDICGYAALAANL